MSGITTFFRHCPSCGRRFEIRLQGKSLVGTERESYKTTKTGTGSPATFTAQGWGFQNVSPSEEIWDSHVLLEEKVRVTIERKNFQYVYMCKHCGHQWIEKRSEESPPKVEEGS